MQEAGKTDPRLLSRNWIQPMRLSKSLEKKILSPWNKRVIPFLIISLIIQETVNEMLQLKSAITSYHILLRSSSQRVSALMSKKISSNIIMTKYTSLPYLKPLRPRRNGRHFADNIFHCIFYNETVRLSLNISLKFVPKVSIDNILALVQIIAWCRPGEKPLCEPMMVSLLAHICVTRPQWVNSPVLRLSLPDRARRTFEFCSHSR